MSLEMRVRMLLLEGIDGRQVKGVATKMGGMTLTPATSTSKCCST